MADNPNEYCRLRSQFIEAAAKYEDEGYRTFIERNTNSEDWYCNNGRNDCVAEIKWPYRPWRKCWILAPSSGTDEEPFAVMKTLFTKAWLWLPRVVSGRIVDAAEWQLSPRVDVGLLWAKSNYEFWCWLLWFDWLWRCGEVETEEPVYPPAGMDLRPFSSSVELIGRWGLDGSAGTFPAWLSLPTAPDPIPAAGTKAGDPAADPRDVAENRQTVANPETMPAQTTGQGHDEAKAIPAESDDPTPIAETDSGSVLLFDRHDSPVVNGKKKSTLTNAQYDVVLALLQTGDKGLTKDELDRKSGRGDARKILKRLSEANSDWQSVILFPGTTGKGYRIL